MVYNHVGLRSTSAGVFDAVADHCVVLAMPNRLGRVVRQLRRDNPHSAVTLQINPGYSGKADLVEKSSKADICHALAEAFRLAGERGYGRLLVLEDDFYLGTPAEASRAGVAADKIARFLEGREFDTYNLGRAVFCGWPCRLGSWRAVAHGTAHGVVYSGRFMRAYLDQHDADPRPIVRVGNDLWWNRAGMVHYVYEDPLVFQTFPRTANRELWNDPVKELGISVLGLDAHHQPGYSILNGLCKSGGPFAAAVLGIAWCARRTALPKNLGEAFNEWSCFRTR